MIANSYMYAMGAISPVEQAAILEDLADKQKQISDYLAKAREATATLGFMVGGIIAAGYTSVARQLMIEVEALKLYDGSLSASQRIIDAKQARRTLLEEKIRTLKSSIAAYPNAGSIATWRSSLIRYEADLQGVKSEIVTLAVTPGIVVKVAPGGSMAAYMVPLVALGGLGLFLFWRMKGKKNAG